MNGGKILYSGEPKGLLEIEESVTAKHLNRYVEI